MTAFSRRPLLLHVQSGQVELFPSDSIRYTEQELENIAKVAQPWNRHASSKTTEEQQVSDHSESETEPTSESETETTSEPETDSEAELSETEINWQWSDSDSELEDETPLAARVFSVALTSFFSPKYSESMIRQFKLRRQTRWLLLQIAGSEPTRLPHSHVTSMKEGMQPIEIHSPELKTEQQSATVQRLSEAVAESYNREQQLEVELASMRARTREDALKIVQLTVENQIRQDLGTYGPLEGVWVRGVPVKRGDDVIHELHALVACSDIYTAVRVHTFLPFHDPETYPANRIRYTDQPWPEALGDRGSSSSQASFRMGWARIIEEHTREEAEAAYRDKTRSVSREEAHGRWGKESLEEIRERIRRISADM
ncbi:hypothetical protein MIND_00078200 [Mycena indigotica]|uniref:Uncharacterized protein n=1 Tax=Mycena indigotica TaxID=2126181 RepID=A0A8H6TBS4_9AGAR|nr:uncharacterized protein MIND_00078200 [Mycena indigotica]KAF7315628.1 hypothetical protein MIND_00078200 [Mycena indigotica]